MQVTIDVTTGSKYEAEETVSCHHEKDSFGSDVEKALAALDDCYRRVRSRLESKLPQPNPATAKVNPTAESRTDTVSSGQIKVKPTSKVTNAVNDAFS